MPKCGWGGIPRCGRELRKRGLCDEHAEIIRDFVAGGDEGEDKRQRFNPERVKEAAETIAAFIEREDRPVTRAELGKLLNVSEQSRLVREAVGQLFDAARLEKHGGRLVLAGYAERRQQALVSQLVKTVLEADHAIKRDELRELVGAGHDELTEALRIARAQGAISVNSKGPNETRGFVAAGSSV